LYYKIRKECENGAFNIFGEFSIVSNLLIIVDGKNHRFPKGIENPSHGRAIKAPILSTGIINP
jgi:hypothetical protein